MFSLDDIEKLRAGIHIVVHESGKAELLPFVVTRVKSTSFEASEIIQSSMRLPSRRFVLPSGKNIAGIGNRKRVLEAWLTPEIYIKSKQ